MLNITEIAFVGCPVADVPRARAFYENLLGLKSSMALEVSPGVWWIEYEIAGVALAITNAWPPCGQGGPTIALEVPDLEAALATLHAAGVNPMFPPVDSPVCRFAVITDPDGNSLTIHSRKACACA